MVDDDFRFRGGRLSLDFAATLAGRYRGGTERLAHPADLGRWVSLAMALEEDVAVTGERLEQARALREAIYRLLHPATRDLPDRAAIGIVNGWASRRDFAPELGADARTVTLRSDRTIEAALATVARDAISLLTGPLLANVRECDRSDCSLLFVDVSRPGQRRWCDMNSCGNRAKARRYRSSHREPVASA
jgi:predicted RNA-binding Zn ribbon-like protein